MSSRITPLVVCGGSGTRLWPASRGDRPKQFLKLFGPLSTFQETILRVTDPSLFHSPVIVTNRKHRFAVAEQLDRIEVEARIVLEPEARDSGPAIAAGTIFIANDLGSEAPILSLAADHMIRDAAAFRDDCVTALKAAAAGHIVTFGVPPDRPACEYGYIEPGAALVGPVKAVRRFVEKPQRETAEHYLREGLVWNSGNFLFRAGVLLEEYAAEDASTIAAVTDAVSQAKPDSHFTYLDDAAFAQARKQSIDHAVLEKTQRAAVLSASFDWSDVGSWRAVRDLLPRDADGNASVGEVFLINSGNSIVSTVGTPVALVGMEDVVVIATGDAILVAGCGDTAGIKKLVDRLGSVARNLV
jgi:mannose-1-phosphate guanylyltransferase/mannose-6-phosphate isomerase